MGYDDPVVGEWANTSYINSGDLGRIEGTLTELFKRDARVRVPKPKERVPRLSDRMQYRGGADNDLWALALIPGAGGWTAIQTAPLELLSERLPNSPRMNLAEVCRRLRCLGLQHHLYDGDSAILAEITPSGDVAWSGGNLSANGKDIFRFHHESPGGEETLQNFIRLPETEQVFTQIPGAAGKVLRGLRNNPYPNMRRSPRPEEVAAALAIAFGGANAGFCDNVTSVGFLIPHRDLPVPGGLALYYRRVGRAKNPRERDARG